MGGPVHLIHVLLCDPCVHKKDSPHHCSKQIKLLVEPVGQLPHHIKASTRNFIRGYKVFGGPFPKLGMAKG